MERASDERPHSWVHGCDSLREQRAIHEPLFHHRATVGHRMSNTDSAAFQDSLASVGLREAERVSQVGACSDPLRHQPIDLHANLSDYEVILRRR